jgi:pimeloyl-ACP methyl ester carboxylesterase
VAAAPTFIPVGDGGLVAVHDLGGDGQPLLLAHATGFLGLTFRRLAGYLSSRFHCLALDFRAHGLSRSGEGWAGEWAGFAEDLLAVVSAMALGRPRAFGHSCGGAALLLAEQAAPGTFAHLYCYEPVVPPFLDPLPPDWDQLLSQGALRRRERFGSRAEALSNFSSKPPLEVLDPGVLQDYVDFGFADAEDGTILLRCRPVDEALIYSEGLSHRAFVDLPKVTCPVDLACGGEAAAYGEDVLRAMSERLGRARITIFGELGHFGPLEQPQLLAEAMIRAFDTPPA